MRAVFAILLAGILFACVENAPTQPTLVVDCPACNEPIELSGYPKRIVWNSQTYVMEDSLRECPVAGDPEPQQCPECEDTDRALRSLKEDQKNLAYQCVNRWGASVVSGGRPNHSEILRRVEAIIDLRPCT